MNGVVVCEGFGEVEYREKTYPVIHFGGVLDTLAVPAVGVRTDVERPAVDDAGEVAFIVQVRLQQPVQLLGHAAGSARTRRRARQRLDGSMLDRADALAAAPHLLRESRPDARAVDEDQPRHSLWRNRILAVSCGIGLLRDPLNFVEALVDTLRRRAGRRVEGLHHEAVEDGKRPPLFARDRDVTFDLVLVGGYDTHVDRHVFFGRTVYGALPDPNGKVGAFVALVPEKRRAEQCLEGAVDESRVEAVRVDLVGELRGIARCGPSPIRFLQPPR